MRSDLYPRIKRIWVEWQLSPYQMALVVELPSERGKSNVDINKRDTKNVSFKCMHETLFLLFDDEDVSKPSTRVSEMIKRKFVQECIESGTIIPSEKWNDALGGVMISYSMEEHTLGVHPDITKQRIISEVLSSGEWKFEIKK